MIFHKRFYYSTGKKKRHYLSIAIPDLPAPLAELAGDPESRECCSSHEIPHQVRDDSRGMARDDNIHIY